MQNNSPNFSSLIKERLRQAGLSFNLALVMTAISTLISFLGVSLLLLEKVSAVAITTVGGAASSAFYLKLAKDANDRLDKLAAKFKDDEKS